MSATPPPGLPRPGRCVVLGVLNVTPDSFSDGGRYLDHDHAVAHGIAMRDAGADLVDVGGVEMQTFFAMSLWTAPFNAARLPAISVPCGFDAVGMPVGLQLVGRPFDEATVLRAGHAYEQATDWHLRRPAV